MFLDCGRKPEYLVRTHACVGRTCTLLAERPPAVNRTQDLLAARQECYQLCHSAAQLNQLKHICSTKILVGNVSGTAGILAHISQNCAKCVLHLYKRESGQKMLISVVGLLQMT
ncbi:hypothetical protein ILYODFUR_018897 [Ilyodon furcidens]|uniref:Uncharacterized protein n=1 Tax=Ilyodon furcidens TaxID=33524 RepID=A0ABV0U8C8_9TELE